MAKIEDRISLLEQKLKQARALKQKIEARKRAIEVKAERAMETRKKILLGALMMNAMAQDEALRVDTMNRLDKYLTRDDDRALFGLAVGDVPNA